MESKLRIHTGLGLVLLCDAACDSDYEVILDHQNQAHIVECEKLKNLTDFQIDCIGLIEGEMTLSEFIMDYRERFKKDIGEWLSDQDDDEPAQKDISGLELFLGMIDLDQLAERHIPGYQGPDSRFEPKPPIMDGDLVDTPDGPGIVYDIEVDHIYVKVFKYLMSTDGIKNYHVDLISPPTKEQQAAYEELI